MQLYFLSYEITGASNVKNFGELVDHFSGQNSIDVISILFSITYFVLRLIYPFGGNLDQDSILEVDAYLKENDLYGLYIRMPLLHLIVFFLLYLQFQYYFLVFDWLSKYYNIIAKGIYDTTGFIVLFVNFAIIFIISYHVLGARMDDGDNYSEDGEYDTSHNDYAFMSMWGVNILSAFRTSVGDLTPPTYDYWIARFELNEDS